MRTINLLLHISTAGVGNRFHVLTLKADGECPGRIAGDEALCTAWQQSGPTAVLGNETAWFAAHSAHEDTGRT